MPGLFGYWTRERQNAESAQLLAMARSMQHLPELKIEFSTFQGFGAGRVHLGHFQPEAQPSVDETHRYSLWLDGEFNNGAELRRTYQREDLTQSGDEDRKSVV